MLTLVAAQGLMNDIKRAELVKAVCDMHKHEESSKEMNALIRAPPAALQYFTEIGVSSIRDAPLSFMYFCDERMEHNLKASEQLNRADLCGPVVVFSHDEESGDCVDLTVADYLKLLQPKRKRTTTPKRKTTISEQVAEIHAMNAAVATAADTKEVRDRDIVRVVTEKQMASKSKGVPEANIITTGNYMYYEFSNGYFEITDCCHEGCTRPADSSIVPPSTPNTKYYCAKHQQSATAN